MCAWKRREGRRRRRGAGDVATWNYLKLLVFPCTEKKKNLQAFFIFHTYSLNFQFSIEPLLFTSPYILMTQYFTTTSPYAFWPKLCINLWNDLEHHKFFTAQHKFRNEFPRSNTPSKIRSFDDIVWPLLWLDDIRGLEEMIVSSRYREIRDAENSLKFFAGSS